jgi:hypothetical protein
MIAAAGRWFTSRILDAEKLETLVIFLEASGDRGEVVTPPPRERRCRRAWLG